MRRVIVIKANDSVDFKITAEIESKHSQLTGNEVRRVVDALTEKLMLSLTDLPYNQVPLGRIRVK